MVEHRDDKRRNTRRPLRAKALIRDAFGQRLAVQLLDVSQGGCALSVPQGELQLGKPVCLKLDGIEALGGFAIWQQNGLLGVEFDRPLYGPVVEDLANRHAPPAPDEGE